MLRKAGLAVALIFAAAGAAVAVDVPPPTAAPAPASPVLAVVCDSAKNKLSVEAHSAQLSEIFRQVGKQGGLSMAIEPDADRPVSLKFTGVSIEQGLRLIAEEGGLNYILFVSKDYKGLPGEVSKITGMRVIGSSKGGAPTPTVAVSVPPTSAPETAKTTVVTSPTGAPPLSPAEESAMAREKERRERRLQSLSPAEREQKLREEEEREKKRMERAAAARARAEKRRASSAGGGGVGIPGEE